MQYLECIFMADGSQSSIFDIIPSPALDLDPGQLVRHLASNIQLFIYIWAIYVQGPDFAAHRGASGSLKLKDQSYAHEPS